jgi:hypothetical protein
MVNIERCDECGVPLQIGRDFRWHGNGVIALANSPRNRMVLFESDLIDNLFKGIGELIGKPIEPIVIESRRRDTRWFIERSFPFEVRNYLVYFDREDQEAGSPFRAAMRESMSRMRKDLNVRMTNVGRIFGYGDLTLSEKWEKGEAYPWRTQIIRNPYSVPLWIADILGAVEAFEGRDMQAGYDKVGDKTYRVDVSLGGHPIELEGKLKRRHHTFKPERCPGCEVPLDVSRYSWDLEDGTITDLDSKRRMVLLGPLALEAVLHDLETKHGESVPQAVIEAHRRYVRSKVSGEEARKSGPGFKSLTALRGLGNITEYEVDDKHSHITIENSCLHLLMIGTTQALYEVGMEIEKSTYEWDLAEDGDLTINIRK